MCGIAGFVNSSSDQSADVNLLTRMVRTLVHRGPDDEGHVVVGQAGLAMRRLSIVDLAGGQQPFTNETGTLHLVANGEIYNHRALRQELEAAGHRFRSQSDIEVLLHGYEAWGLDVLRRVRGMFALALWDAAAHTLVIARDRAGEKPLYWTQTAGALRFASELKALLACPDVAREVDADGLDQFLTYEYVVAPRTILEQVWKLPPASVLVWSGGTATVTRYWDAAQVAPRTWSDAEAIEAVRDRLEAAVASQLMADVPLGAFLSGGVDSSALVALMSRQSSRPVNTFSMGFDDGSYNELEYAREVAVAFRTQHRERTVTPDLRPLFDRLVTHLDEPFADVSLFPTYMVSSLAREHVTVALSGDGGDEVFGGYDAYAAQAAWARLGWLGPALVPLADAVLSQVRPTEQKKGLVNSLKRFAAGATAAPSSLGHYRWMTYQSATTKQRLYRPALREALRSSDVYAPVREALARWSDDDTLNRQLYADLCVYLPDDILVKVDRMSMATSLETRAPFLDADVMELAFSMPGHLKIRNGERKWVLKQAMRGLLPEGILTRRKQGFSIPMKNWLRRDLQPLMRELLSPERIEARGWFDAAEVTRLVEAHVVGRENHAHTLFPLMVLERWCTAHLPS